MTATIRGPTPAPLQRARAGQAAPLRWMLRSRGPLLPMQSDPAQSAKYMLCVVTVTPAISSD